MRLLLHEGRGQQGLLYVPRFGGVAFEKAPSSRDIGKKVRNGDAATPGATANFVVKAYAIVVEDFCPMRVVVIFCLKQYFGHTGNRRQSLASETEALQLLQILDVDQFARRVALKGQLRIFGAHANAIVFNGEKSFPAFLIMDANVVGTGVEAVFNELLDDSGRSFDHFTGGDLIGDVNRQHMDLIHGSLNLKAPELRNLFENKNSILSFSGGHPQLKFFVPLSCH
jgi:hypothetical protein